MSRVPRGGTRVPCGVQGRRSLQLCRQPAVRSSLQLPPRPGCPDATAAVQPPLPSAQAQDSGPPQASSTARGLGPGRLRPAPGRRVNQPQAQAAGPDGGAQQPHANGNRASCFLPPPTRHACDILIAKPSPASPCPAPSPPSPPPGRHGVLRRHAAAGAAGQAGTGTGSGGGRTPLRHGARQR